MAEIRAKLMCGPERIKVGLLLVPSRKQSVRLPPSANVCGSKFELSQTATIDGDPLTFLSGDYIMRSDPFPLTKASATILAQDAIFELYWYTAILSSGATAILWPGQIVSQSQLALVGINVVALELRQDQQRVCTTWFHHTLDAVTRVHNEREAIFRAFVSSRQSVPDAHQFLS